MRRKRRVLQQHPQEPIHPHLQVLQHRPARPRRHLDRRPQVRQRRDPRRRVLHLQQAREVLKVGQRAAARRDGVALGVDRRARLEHEAHRRVLDKVRAHDARGARVHAGQRREEDQVVDLVAHLVVFGEFDRRQAAEFPSGGVDARVVEERAHHVEAAVFAGQHERGEFLLVGCVDVDVAFLEDPQRNVGVVDDVQQGVSLDVNVVVQVQRQPVPLALGRRVQRLLHHG